MSKLRILDLDVKIYCKKKLNEQWPVWLENMLKMKPAESTFMLCFSWLCFFWFTVKKWRLWDIDIQKKHPLCFLVLLGFWVWQEERQGRKLLPACLHVFEDIVQDLLDVRSSCLVLTVGSIWLTYWWPGLPVLQSVRTDQFWKRLSWSERFWLFNSNRSSTVWNGWTFQTKAVQFFCLIWMVKTVPIRITCL